MGIKTEAIKSHKTFFGVIFIAIPSVLNLNWFADEYEIR